MNGIQKKSHKSTNMGKVKDSNYDGNCTSRHCLSGTYEISGRLIFVEQSVPIPVGEVVLECVSIFADLVPIPAGKAALQLWYKC